jgi:hypothetical protein
MNNEVKTLRFLFEILEPKITGIEKAMAFMAIVNFLQLTPSQTNIMLMNYRIKTFEKNGLIYYYV